MRTTRNFPNRPESVPEARRFVSELLSEQPEETVMVVELMVSELATNCVRHTSSGFALTVRHSDSRIRVEVTDEAAGKPTMRSPGPTEPSGRGLRIVDTLSANWGVQASAGRGKTVWFTVESEARAASTAG